MLSEKHRPSTTNNLILDPKIIDTIRESIRSNIPVLLHGPPGSGKTSSTYAVAKEFGLRVIEVNASDERKKNQMENILKSSSMEGFFEVLYLFDEVDSLADPAVLVEILKRSLHPIVLTANEVWNISEKVREYCKIVKFRKPELRSVVDYVKRVSSSEHIAPSYSNIVQDFRAGLHSAFYGSEGYASHNDFDTVRDIFEKGIVPEDVDRSILIWLSHNAPRFYYGQNLNLVYEVICEADRTGNLNLLKLLPKGHGSPEYPYYLKRRRVLHGD